MNKLERVLADHDLANLLLANRAKLAAALKFTAYSLWHEGSTAEARAYLQLHDQIKAAGQ